ncbi:MAG: hypothetical protein R3F60_29010 [bacterium]
MTWVDGTESAVRAYAGAVTCAPIRGQPPPGPLRPPTLLESLSTWQPNPAGTRVEDAVLGNRRFDWLMLANGGRGVHMGVDGFADASPVFYGAEEVPGVADAAWLVSFISGQVSVVSRSSPEAVGRVRCVRP